MRSGWSSDDLTDTAALRERLLAADREITVPAGLFERVTAAPAAAGGPGQRHRTAGWVVAAVVAVCVLAIGCRLLIRPPGSQAAVRPAPTLTVYNAEAPCRALRTMECALRLARDPHGRYAAAGNGAGEVWHGDRLGVTCVVTDGTLVLDESGITSRRWYLVATAAGVRGWLPGVRTRNTTPVPDCDAAQERSTLQVM
ncbi:hypothetical protein [Streptantibioticus silvisoli]|uniref:DUF3515 family protein n=1 Tax=Streptantibioticus silvisoli TaxID=2705255 RepID=A0ABT6W4A4_9ACTN|nr:hypothetical protein [Streptantibioticus silvisoli]MDI5964503.1 hypothetical protein [Streptantibioticus silvisoli]